MSKNTLSEEVTGVLKQEHILLCYEEKKQDKEPKKLLLRRITYQEKRVRKYVFFINNTSLTLQDIAHIYKQLHHLYGESENAICIQIWCTLIDQLLLTVLQRKTETKKAFSTIASLVKQHLLSYLNLKESLKNSKRFYEKRRKTVDYSDSLFPLSG